jgi:two-component system, NtrC family, response regulator
MERALVLHRGGALGPEHFEDLRVTPSAADPFSGVPLEVGFHESVAQLEKNLVERALRAAGDNRSRAAELLKINRRLLYDKLKEFGLD